MTTSEINSPNTDPLDLPIICSNCFTDVGLRLDAERIGQDIPGPCPNCGLSNYKKLPISGLGALAHRYFVWGSMRRAWPNARSLCTVETAFVRK